MKTMTSLYLSFHLCATGHTQQSDCGPLTQICNCHLVVLQLSFGQNAIIWASVTQTSHDSPNLAGPYHLTFRTFPNLAQPLKTIPDPTWLEQPQWAEESGRVGRGSGSGSGLGYLENMTEYLSYGPNMRSHLTLMVFRQGCRPSR